MQLPVTPVGNIKNSNDISIQHVHHRGDLGDGYEHQADNGIWERGRCGRGLGKISCVDFWLGSYTFLMRLP